MVDKIDFRRVCRQAMDRLRSNPGRAVVWGGWFILTLLACYFVWAHSTNLPFWDEWSLVPLATGQTSLDFATLWQQHNEHRILLPRLVLVALLHLTGFDFRSGMYATVILLSAASAVLVMTAAGLRGRSSVLDLFFPLVLLNWSQAENLIWAFQVGFSLPVFLVVANLALMVRPGAPSAARLLLILVLLSLLPMCGGSGLPYVVLGTAWSMYVVIWELKDRPRSVRIALAASSFLVLSLVPFYFRHYETPRYLPPAPGLQEATKYFAAVASLGLGGAGQRYWPYQAGFVLAVAALVAGSACWSIAKDRDSRCQVFGLLVVLVGTCGLAAGIAWGRSGLGGGEFSSRYVTLMAPLPCAMFLFGCVDRAKRLGWFVQVSLLVFAALVGRQNYRSGVTVSKTWFEPKLRPAYHALREGGSVNAFVARYGKGLYPDRQALEAWCDMLRRKGIGRFRYLSAPNSGADSATREGSFVTNRDGQ